MKPVLRWLLIGLYVLLPDPIPGPIDDLALLVVFLARDGPDLAAAIKKRVKP